MKTLKSVTLAFALLVTCSFVKANDVPEIKLTKTHAINTYLDAMTLGRIENLSQVIDPCAKFSILRGKTIMSFTKQEMTDYLEGEKNIQQQCTTKTQVIESNSDMAVIRVDMKFADFTRSNYVTVANTGGAWKITSVYSVFK
jgi:hypothetical protein